MRSIHYRRAFYAVFLVLFLTSTVFAQTSEQASLRKIEVTGSAEREIVPDEIYFLISLREYMNGTNKTTIDQLENQLQRAVKRAGVDPNDLRIEDVQGFRNYWQKQKEKNFLTGKQYRLKLKTPDKINEILAGIDDKGIDRTDVLSYSHSQIETFRREVKIEALKAAREKATYLLAAIDEQVGPVQEIQEIDNGYSGPQPMMRVANMAMEADAAAAPPIDFKTIKLRYEVRTVFAIQ
ncbi:hypothetical protein SAMN05421823_103660 [Catalinimonas alkaloidigena]|uniref:SIMPL domain-containing protein n=1 Tax=Catalinimonas alkaloidigena TaxID=1075417 RepID=A0A1G9F3P2_9BACT|nr:SIMPL domain-containing protein [Catalinimonas alkaloidigena]SDK82853.1 hypothetical protein SAMN05421823_103660 [Catalinimonas alkaloidigena]